METDTLLEDPLKNRRLWNLPLVSISRHAVLETLMLTELMSFSELGVVAGANQGQSVTRSVLLLTRGH
jgi:hypothetical protein